MTKGVIECIEICCFSSIISSCGSDYYRSWHFTLPILISSLYWKRLSEVEMRVYEHLLLAHLEVEYVFIGGHLDLLERNLCLHLQTIVIDPTKCMTAV